ncbi:hypothetical protein [Methyloglobulus sp.]|uniref:hypothetical protein n=1 Tax=Methyloglobulus sp. TaxID=2518622 RepID=UPI003989B0D8
MIKQIVPILGIIILLGTLPCFQVSANSGPNFKSPDFLPSLSYGDTFELIRPNTILIKLGEKYDGAKDPALRKGTEN